VTALALAHVLCGHPRHGCRHQLVAVVVALDQGGVARRAGLDGGGDRLVDGDAGLSQAWRIRGSRWVHVSTVGSSIDEGGNCGRSEIAQNSESMPRVDRAVGKNDISSPVVITTSVELVSAVNGCLDACLIELITIDLRALVNVELDWDVAAKDVIGLVSRLEIAELCARLPHPAARISVYRVE